MKSFEGYSWQPACLADLDMSGIQPILQQKQTTPTSMKPLLLALSILLASTNIPLCALAKEYIDPASREAYCLPHTARVNMADGSSKPIMDIIAGDVVKAWEVDTQQSRDATVTAAYAFTGSDNIEIVLVRDRKTGTVAQGLRYSGDMETSFAPFIRYAFEVDGKYAIFVGTTGYCSAFLDQLPDNFFGGTLILGPEAERFRFLETIGWRGTLIEFRRWIQSIWY